MLILLYGKDSYRQKIKIEELVVGGGKISYFKTDPIKSLSLIEDEIRQKSIFQEKRTLVIFGLLGQKKLDKKSISFLNNYVGEKEIIIIFVEEKKQIFPFDKIFEISPLKGGSLKKWAHNEIIIRGGDIDDSALIELINNTGDNLWLLSSEIDKIISYKKGEKILIDDISLMTRPAIEEDIFKLIDLIASGDRKGSLKLIYSHIEKGDALSYILSMIGYQFRNLISVKKGGSMKELDMHPFVFNKSLSLSQKWTEKALEEMYDRILLSDVAIKTGKIEPNMVLDLLIFKI